MRGNERRICARNCEKKESYELRKNFIIAAKMVERSVIHILEGKSSIVLIFEVPKRSKSHSTKISVGVAFN